MKKMIVCYWFFLGLFSGAYANTPASAEVKNVAIVKGMLHQFFEKLDLSKIDNYFT